MHVGLILSVTTMIMWGNVRRAKIDLASTLNGDGSSNVYMGGGGGGGGLLSKILNIILLFRKFLRKKGLFQTVGLFHLEIRLA